MNVIWLLLYIVLPPDDAFINPTAIMHFAYNLKLIDNIFVHNVNMFNPLYVLSLMPYILTFNLCYVYIFWKCIAKSYFMG